jgi:hypothetical protein
MGGGAKWQSSTCELSGQGETESITSMETLMATDTLSHIFRQRAG